MTAPAEIYPGNLARVWVRGRLINLAKAAAGDPNPGLAEHPITFTPRAGVLVDRGSQQVLTTGSFTAFPAKNDGYFQIQLPATDDPDVTPTDWTFQVVEPTGRSYDLWVPENTPILNAPGDRLDGQKVIELSDSIAAAPSGGTVQLMAGRGVDSMAVRDIDGTDHLFATYTDGTEQDLGPVMAAPATTLTVGTVTSVGSGSTASATISGTAPNQTLDLSIPRGTAGTPGAPGSTGPQGADGAQGATGAAGTPGPANTLTIGTVSTGLPGTSAAATITGTAPDQTLSLTLPMAGYGAAFSGRCTTAATVPTSVWTPIPIDTEIFDSHDWHSTATNPSRYVPRQAGYFLVTGWFNPAGLWTTGHAGLSIGKNGGQLPGMSYFNASGTNAMTATKLVYFNGSTDYAELLAWQDSGSNKTITYDPTFQASASLDVFFVRS